MSDFVEVKFFENRANGQSKGFCVISLGSEQSMRICMERLPKKELHGQSPVVTFPTKQALNQVCITMKNSLTDAKYMRLSLSMDMINGNLLFYMFLV